MSLHSTSVGRPQRLLCVFAHPDDEVFCAGGLLARWVAENGEAMVVSATRGEAGQIRDARAATRATLGAVRERELRSACAALGVQQVRCLDHRDGTLHMVSQAALAAEVATLVRDFDADVVVTFGPDGGYGHPDHIAISHATTRACQLIQSAGERVPHLYYSAFPCQHQRLSNALADWLDRAGTEFVGDSAFVQALSLLAEEAVLLRYCDDSVQTQWFPAGFAIVEQGELADSLFLIVSGRARASEVDEHGGERVSRLLGPGQFFGVESLARSGQRAETVIALDTVTCLVIAPRASTAYAGRGEGLPPAGGDAPDAGQGAYACDRYITVESSAYDTARIAALAAHRTQFAFDPAPFPPALLRALLGVEYFERASAPASPWALTEQARGAYLLSLREVEGIPA
jgi:LmbE family N-acetylglucosaminyl deacetylase